VEGLGVAFVRAARGRKQTANPGGIAVKGLGVAFVRALRGRKQTANPFCAVPGAGAALARVWSLSHHLPLCSKPHIGFVACAVSSRRRIVFAIGFGRSPIGRRCWCCSIRGSGIIRLGRRGSCGWGSSGRGWRRWRRGIR